MQEYGVEAWSRPRSPSASAGLSRNLFDRLLQLEGATGLAVKKMELGGVNRELDRLAGGGRRTPLDPSRKSSAAVISEEPAFVGPALAADCCLHIVCRDARSVHAEQQVALRAESLDDVEVNPELRPARIAGGARDGEAGRPQAEHDFPLADRVPTP